MADWTMVAGVATAAGAAIAAAGLLYQMRRDSGASSRERAAEETAQADAVTSRVELQLWEVRGLEGNAHENLRILEMRDREAVQQDRLRELTAILTVKNASNAPVVRLKGYLEFRDVKDNKVDMLGSTELWLDAVGPGEVKAAEAYFQWRGTTPRSVRHWLRFTDARFHHWERDSQAGQLQTRSEPAVSRPVEGGNFFQW